MWVAACLISLAQWFLKYTGLYMCRYMSRSAATGMRCE